MRLRGYVVRIESNAEKESGGEKTSLGEKGSSDESGQNAVGVVFTE
jgi:hypothetical protein